jgi:hypothetical protein
MGIKVTIDRVAIVEKAIAELAQTRVMVGIPMDSEKNTRDDGAELTNAEIGYINEIGAPEANLPPRPFLVPGVAGIKDEVISRLKAVGRDALAGKASAVTKGLMALGLVGQNAVREKITAGPFVPLSPRTIAARRRKHIGRQAITAADVTPLVSTGQLRNAITFAIRKIKR